ncbi:DEAD/DEAH box helicase [Halomonas denitrificans]|nr:DEAD/DEAH box helicase [Halomonas denitrificans]
MTLFSAVAQFDAWFAEAVGAPTPIQQQAWPALRSGRHALLIAGTGQGKSLAAWRPVAERLVDRPDAVRGVRALHIAPLKALARDMLNNLGPLLDAAGELRGRPVRRDLRCGDTPVADRRAQVRRPPEVLSTTPETLFVLLGSPSGRRMLRTLETVVVDEVHALAPGRRGAHLALSLARLDVLCGRAVHRIGLSATAEPVDALACWLGGEERVEVIAPETNRDQAPRLIVERPGPALGAYAGTALWEAIHERLATLAGRDGGLLVFCQTRAQVERTALALGERLGHERVGAHHGSLDSACRTDVEARFREGRLDVLVGSASLELGLDLGTIERVAQLGSPGGLNALRQRAGRSRHRPGQRSVLHWFPLTRHQLLEVEAVEDALRAGAMDRLTASPGYRDVLAQQLVAMVAADGVDSIDAALDRIRRAWPWRSLTRESLAKVVEVLVDAGVGLPAAQRTTWLLRAGDDRLVVPPGARQRVLANAGTIPEWFEYTVMDVVAGEAVGRLDEEFAFESSPGQVIQLGHRAFRILRVRCGRVEVEPAEDEPAAALPFWFGEGAGRTDAVSRSMLKAIERGSRRPETQRWLAEAEAALGALPAPDRLVVERFLDPNGDRHLVLHTLAGARVNRAWGLALRKRFCRQFNFELQAAATDDGVLISLGVTSDFEVADVVGFVRASNVRAVLTQALLDTPLFLTRFRWAANTALVLPRVDAAGPVPAQQQRSRTENLVAQVFPDQLACLENLAGPREVPDHPLVHQALDDCLHDYMDLDGLTTLLEAVEQGRMAVHAVDLDRPSVLAEGLIHAPRHSFLDEAAAEERRTRSFEPVPGRAGAGPGRTPPGSRGVAAETARPLPADRPTRERDASFRPTLDDRCDALEKLLGTAGFLTVREGERGVGMAGSCRAGGWTRRFSELVRQRRAVALRFGDGKPQLWVRLDRLGLVRRAWPDLVPSPWVSDALVPACDKARRDAFRELNRRRSRLGLGWPSALPSTPGSGGSPCPRRDEAPTGASSSAGTGSKRSDHVVARRAASAGTEPA